jgi:hypothetical protein
VAELTISAKERAEIVEPASALVAAAKAFRVTTVETYSEAGERLKAIKGAAKRLEDKKRTLLNPVNATLKAIRDLFRAPEDELLEAENLYKRELAGYSARLEAERRVAQQAADEAARKERERFERQAAADAAKAAKEREAGNLAKAEALEQRSMLRTDAAASVVAPIVQVEAPRVAGISGRDNWYAVVLDKKALVDAIAAGTVPITAFEPNMKFLNNQAKAMKKDLAYPGVQACKDTVIAAGSR